MDDEKDTRRTDEENEPPKKKKKFDWFGLYRLEGKGVDKDEVPIIKEPTFLNFFKLFGRKWNMLISVNLLLVFGNFPIFFYMIYRAGYFGISSTAPYYQNFIPLYGTAMFNKNAATAALYGIFGMQVPITANTPATLVFLFLTVLVFFTFGPVNSGVTYITRGMLRGDPIFLWQDFWHTVKKNIRQSIPMGILDLGALLLLINDIRFFRANLTSPAMFVMLSMSTAMLVIYFMVRFYVYHIMITFDLGFFKILKNSLIFSVLGIKRNIMGLLGGVIVIAINYLILSVYIPVGIVLPFVITPAILTLIGTYAAYPKIKEIMIDPYYDENGDPLEDDDGDEASDGSEDSEG